MDNATVRRTLCEELEAADGWEVVGNLVDALTPKLNDDESVVKAFRKAEVRFKGYNIDKKIADLLYIARVEKNPEASDIKGLIYTLRNGINIQACLKIIDCLAPHAKEAPVTEALYQEFRSSTTPKISIKLIDILAFKLEENSVKALPPPKKAPTFRSKVAGIFDKLKPEEHTEQYKGWIGVFCHKLIAEKDSSVCIKLIEVLTPHLKYKPVKQAFRAKLEHCKDASVCEKISNALKPPAQEK